MSSIDNNKGPGNTSQGNVQGDPAEKVEKSFLDKIISFFQTKYLGHLSNKYEERCNRNTSKLSIIKKLSGTINQYGEFSLLSIKLKELKEKKVDRKGIKNELKYISSFFKEYKENFDNERAAFKSGTLDELSQTMQDFIEYCEKPDEIYVDPDDKYAEFLDSPSKQYLSGSEIIEHAQKQLDSLQKKIETAQSNFKNKLIEISYEITKIALRN